MKSSSPSFPKSLLPSLVLGCGIATASAGIPALGPASTPETSGLDSEFHVGYNSDYIFRGDRRGGDLYEFGFDFAGSGQVPLLGDLDWSAGVWYASYEVDSPNLNSSNNELDVYAEVRKPLNDVVSIAVGIINYSYFGNGAPGGTNDDVEPYVAIGIDFFALDLGFAFYYDGSDNYRHDFYSEFTAGYEHEISERLTANLEAVIGVFDESNANPAKGSDVYYGGTASLSVAVTDQITVTPYVAATSSSNLGDYFFGGVSVGFGF